MLALAFAFAAHAQSASDEQGSMTFQRTCSTCHGISTVTAHRLNQAGWENVVDNMVSRGARATPDEQQEIVRYLTANYGVDAAAPKNTASGEEAAEEGPAPVVAPPHPAPPVPALSDAQIAHAKQLMSANGCLSCHRLQGEGSFAGVDLSDAGMKESATQIRASLISPPKELAPENRSVRLTTQDGKTMVGKLLNQDAFTVQLIDAAGRLMSLDKANLREFTIMTANGMPSYADKIAPQDLSLLISYLATLRTTAQP